MSLQQGALRARLMIIVAVVSLLVQAMPAWAAGSTSSYSQPRWWQKFLIVSAPGFTPLVNPGPRSNTTVGANVDVSNEPGPQSETSIAINPNNTSQLVAGSNEIYRLPMRAYHSADGGASWGAVDLPLPPPLSNSGVDFGSDPGVAWDTRGNVYYSYIVVFFNKSFAAVTGTEMAVARSGDGGSTWATAYFNLNTGTAAFNDKPMIAVDTNPASPFRDTIYVAWDTAASGSASTNNVVLVSRSTDGGGTFSAPVAASAPKRAGIGADPFVGPDGTLYVAWHDITGNQIAVSSSADGGRTFGPANGIAHTLLAFDIAIPAQNTRGALVYPACGADSSNGPNRGALYCSWMDLTTSNGTDIFMARSLDRGVTWSSPLRVNDDAAAVANDQFNQWLAVDAIDGSVNLSWNDTRLDPTHVSTDIFYARSANGASFAPNARVTTDPTNETCCGADLGNQYGDYEGIAALGGIARPVWTDRRAAVATFGEEVFTARIRSR